MLASFVTPFVTKGKGFMTLAPGDNDGAVTTRHSLDVSRRAWN
jgi:hypothetical protein